VLAPNIWSLPAYTLYGDFASKLSLNLNPPFLQIQVAYDLARAVFIVAMGCLFVSSHLPRASIFPGQSLAPGEYLGTCVFMPSLRGCEPTIAVMETSGALSVYSGQYPSDPSKKLLWTRCVQSFLFLTRICLSPKADAHSLTCLAAGHRRSTLGNGQQW
jgi:hypothetical protein